MRAILLALTVAFSIDCSFGFYLPRIPSLPIHKLSNAQPSYKLFSSDAELPFNMADYDVTLSREEELVALIKAGN